MTDDDDPHVNNLHERLGALTSDMRSSQQDRRDLWQAMKELRDIVAKNASDQGIVLNKMSNFVDSAAALATQVDKAIGRIDRIEEEFEASHKEYTKRENDRDIAEAKKEATRKVERRIIIVVAAGIWLVGSAILIWWIEASLGSYLAKAAAHATK